MRSAAVIADVVGRGAIVRGSDFSGSGARPPPAGAGADDTVARGAHASAGRARATVSEASLERMILD
jgi:hypothetical protein